MKEITKIDKLIWDMLHNDIRINFRYILNISCENDISAEFIFKKIWIFQSFIASLDTRYIEYYKVVHYLLFLFCPLK